MTITNTSTHEVHKFQQSSRSNAIVIKSLQFGLQFGLLGQGQTHAQVGVSKAVGVGVLGLGGRVEGEFHELEEPQVVAQVGDQEVLDFFGGDFVQGGFVDVQT